MKSLHITPAALKNIEQLSYYDVDNFVKDARRYIKACKEERIICSINHVSSSGMSRDLKFLEFDKKNSKGSLMTFFSVFKILDFKEAKNNRGYFKIGGCGMDMVFHTNYTIIHELHRMGFMTQKQCSILCQKTPQTM